LPTKASERLSLRSMTWGSKAMLHVSCIGLRSCCKINVGHDLDLTSLNHGHLDYKGRSPIIFGFLPLVATSDAVLPICLNTKLSTMAKWTNCQWNVYWYQLRVISNMWLVKSSDAVGQMAGN
jgi:hypothetical protein